MPQLRRLAIRGHTIAALTVREGQGEPLILLHGVMNSPAFWLADSVFSQLGPSYALSLPGHAPGAFPPGFRREELTAELMADLLRRAVVELIGAQPFTLAGLSTGGFAALALAVELPAQVRRLICISGFAQGRWRGLLGRFQTQVRRGGWREAQVRAFLMGGKLHRRIYRSIWRHLVADRASIAGSQPLRCFEEALFPDYRWLSTAAMSHYYARMPDLDIRARLPHIIAPTLVLVGTADRAVPPQQSELIAPLVPDATLVRFEGAGHILAAERPAEYAAAIHEWLAREKQPSPNRA